MQVVQAEVLIKPWSTPLGQRARQVRGGWGFFQLKLNLSKYIVPGRELLKVLQHCSAVSWTKPYIPSSIKCKLNSKCKTWIKKKPNKAITVWVGWWLPSLVCKRNNLCNHSREGAEEQDRVFVFALLYINSPPCFCQRWSLCAGTGRPWDCAWGQLPLWPEQAALALMPELWGSSNAALCDLCCLGALFTAPALAFCTKPGPSVPFAAQGTFPTACGPLLYTTHLQWGDLSRTVWKCISLSWMPYLKSKGTWQPPTVPPLTEAESRVTNCSRV